MNCSIYQYHLCSDVYLTLNGVFVPNHGYVILDDIGTSGDGTALLCHTNRHPPPGSSNSGGDWFGPDGDRISNSNVPGFMRNRDSMVVRLYRYTASVNSPVEGIYYCQIEDDTYSTQIVTVGLYNSVEGNKCVYTACVLYILILNLPP